MPTWTLQISRSVVGDLRARPKDIRGSAAVSILELTTQPRPHGVEKLSGYPSTYRIRAGDYRIVYEIGASTLTVIAVRHRKEVYRDLT